MTIFSLVLSIVSALGIGSIFAKSISGRLVLGLSFAALIAGPFIYLNVQYVRPIQLFLFMIGLILQIRITLKYIRITPALKSAETNIFQILSRLTLQIIFTTGFLIVILNQFSRTRYVYESHDVLYMGWISEIWNADYNGKIRVPTMWPLEMSSQNTLTSIILSQLNVIGHAPNLADIVEIRYLFLIAISLVFIFEDRDTTLKKIVSIGLSSVLPFLLFHRELSYSLGMSSFWYVIILLSLCKEIFIYNNRNNCQLLLVYFSILIIAKAQLFIISSVCIAYLCWKYRDKLLARGTLVMFMLCAFNFVYVLFVPRAEGSKLGIPLPFAIKPEITGDGIRLNWAEIIASSNGIVDWYLGPEKRWITNMLLNIELQALFVFVLILMKTFFVYAIVRKKLYGKDSSFHVLDLYMAMSLFSVVVIRNGGLVGHQAHAYLLACVITFMCSTLAIERFGKRFKFAALVAAVLLISKLETSALPYRSENQEKLRSYPDSSLRLSEDLDQIDPKNGGKLQVWFAIKGIRLVFDPNKDYSHSQVSKFSLNSKEG